MIDLDNTLMYKTMFKLIRHDTRNTFVKLDALLGDLDPSPVTDMISDSIQELYDIIASATGFIDGKRRILSLYDIISELSLTSDKITLTNHHRIKFSYDPKVYLFVEVSDLFNHSLLNVIENALKYSDESEIVEVSVVRNPDHILVSVKDRGIGIPSKLRDKVFEQGFRTDEAIVGYEGTGIGLWITKNIILKNHGSITIEDNDEGGTIFNIKVPIFFTENFEDSIDIVLGNYLDDPKELSECIKSVKTLIDLHNPPSEYHYDSLIFANLLNYLRKEKRNKTKSHFKDRLEEIKSKNPSGKTIVIVDDSTYVHYYLGSFFSDLGYKVLDFGYNGKEGFNLYEKYKPDLITLDITMPIMSGIEASEKIISIDNSANILFLSGLGNHEGLIKVIDEKMKNKVYGILSKPFTLDDLKESLYTFNF